MPIAKFRLYKIPASTIKRLNSVCVSFWTTRRWPSQDQCHITIIRQKSQSIRRFCPGP